MADFKLICEWVMRQEDPTLDGVIVDLGDGQGATRYGIAQKAHPEVTHFYFTELMPASSALLIAEAIYRDDYWNRFQGDAIESDQVASCLLSFAINDGTSREVMLLQECLNIPVDGFMGPVTLEHTNAYTPEVLAVALRAAQADFYRAVVAKVPEDARFLPGWLARAYRVYPSLK